MERTKDKLLVFRSTIRKKDSKGRDVITVYMTPEAVEDAIACLEASRGNPKGAKITIHTGKKEHEGRSFDSSFGFIKGCENNGSAAPGASTPGRFVPKTQAKAASVAERDSKISSLRAKTLE